jgi:hypothetical protein
MYEVQYKIEENGVWTITSGSDFTARVYDAAVEKEKMFCSIYDSTFATCLIINHMWKLKPGQEKVIYNGKTFTAAGSEENTEETAGAEEK